MKKLMYLIIIALILALVLTGCSVLSNIGQVPTNEQSRTNGTIVINGCDTGVADTLYDGELISVQIQELYDAAKNHGQFVRGVAALTKDLMKEGFITGKEKGKIQSCAAKSEVFPETVLAVGDSYQGGIVAYIDGSGIHGLIAATTDQTPSTAGIIWAIPAYQNTAVPGGTLFSLGSGSANTDKIIAQNGGGTSYAAGLARAYDGGGYDDWFLPSQDELNQLYINKVAIGGFADYSYWSSSEYTADSAWSQYFYVGSQGTNDKPKYARVRAVRAF